MIGFVYPILEHFCPFSYKLPRWVSLWHCQCGTYLCSYLPWHITRTLTQARTHTCSHTQTQTQCHMHAHAVTHIVIHMHIHIMIHTQTRFTHIHMMIHTQTRFTHIHMMLHTDSAYYAIASTPINDRQEASGLAISRQIVCGQQWACALCICILVCERDYEPAHCRLC